MLNQNTPSSSPIQSSDSTRLFKLLIQIAKERPVLTTVGLFSILLAAGGSGYLLYRSDFFGRGNRIIMNREGVTKEGQHLAQVKAGDITENKEEFNAQAIGINPDIQVGDIHAEKGVNLQSIDTRTSTETLNAIGQLRK